MNGLRSETGRENGRGEIFAVQLRGELSVGRELPSHRIRASSRTSRRWPRRPGHSPQTVLLRSQSLPSRSHLSPQLSPRYSSFSSPFQFVFSIWRLLVLLPTIYNRNGYMNCSYASEFCHNL